LPDFIKISRLVAEIWQFNGFQNVNRPPSWIFEFLIFLTVGAVKTPILYNYTKFCRDRSNRCGDIAFFVIFKMAAAAMLDFQKNRNFNDLSTVSRDGAT